MIGRSFVADHPAFIWWNGSQMPWNEANVHVTELGWSTVGAVFEGIRAYWSDQDQELYVFRLEEHLVRLENSMRMVRLPLPYDRATLTQVIKDLVIANGLREDCYIRPMGYQNDSYNYRWDRPGAQSCLVIDTKPMATHLQTGLTITAKVSSWRRISDDIMPPRIKNLSNYRNGQLGRLEAQYDGYDTCLFLNAQGKISEGPGACVMMVRNGKLVTPGPTESILESITLDTIKTLAGEVLGIEVVERSIDRTEFYIAEEAFMVGTAAEISPVVSVDKYDVGTGKLGPVTAALEKAYNDVLRGTESRYPHWRTAVGVRAGVR